MDIIFFYLNSNFVAHIPSEKNITKDSSSTDLEDKFEKATHNDEVKRCTLKSMKIICDTNLHTI